tara:strand:+ start:32102 stop:32464 length:363 start_codon:yes stop_codon:yes gene_type:complete
MKVRIGPYRKNRATRVEIEPHDTWSMDHTLAMIIHPMLVQLKATQNGHPADLTEARWNEILDEMIWAFKHKSKEIDAGDMCRDKCASYGDPICQACLKDTQERLTNAFKLFGEYYENLWD